jgi:PIN domain nuclease of toxin-antitoxin system
MVVLLDTSVVLHLALDQARISKKVRTALLDANTVFLTPIARSEIATKLAIGKLDLPNAEPEFWKNISDRLQAKELPYDCSHAAVLVNLPLIHRDPFDRMIAAQCLKEDVYLATTDPIFEKYGVKVL